MSHSTADERLDVLPDLVEPNARRVRRYKARASIAARRLGAEGVCAAIATAVYAYGLTTPAPWRDEAATMVVARRNIGQLAAMAGHVDLVHVSYYFLAHVALMLGDSLTTVRLLSLLAMSTTAVLLVRLGRAFSQLQVGVLAALILALSPIASRYAQEARSPAVATMLVTWSVLALVSALRERTARSWATYGLLLVLSALVNVLGLVVVGAHGALVIRSDRRAIRPWLLTVSASVAALLPFLAAALQQQGQLWWLRSPSVDELIEFTRAEMGSRWVFPAAVFACVVVALRRRKDRMSDLILLAIPWALADPVLVWTFSQFHPLWQSRYVLPALPGAALLMAAAATELTRELMHRLAASRLRAIGTSAVPVILAVVLVGVPGLPQQLDARTRVGHGEDVVAVAHVLRQQGRSEDGLLFLPSDLRVVRLYSSLPGMLFPNDTALDRAAGSDGTLTGKELRGPALQAAMSASPRLWVVHVSGHINETASSSDPQKLAVLHADFRMIRSIASGIYSVDLYERVYS